MSFLDKYEPVDVRLARFWGEHPHGRVITEIVEHDGQRCVFRAAIWRHAADLEPAATGFAHEVVTSRGVNATSMLENCETSAIGRALANLGFAPTGARPSREEMSKGRDTGGFATVDEWRERVAEVRDMVTDADATDWVKAQDFPWPWPADVIDQIIEYLTAPAEVA